MVGQAGSCFFPVRPAWGTVRREAGIETMTTDVSTWGLVRDGRAPFVGREAELKTLEEALGAVKAGETRVVSPVGPAGIGKSRLIQDFILRHRAPGLQPVGG